MSHFFNLITRSKSDTKQPFHERFWEKVDKESGAPCWNWTGTCRKKACFINADGKTKIARRVAWEFCKFNLLGGMTLTLLCGNPRCVFPGHMECLITDEQRFFKYVDRKDPKTGCLLWQGNLCPNGYGKFILRTADGRREQQAHRASFLLFRGKIPEGLLIRHQCDNRRCVNPAHLFPGTHADNARDRTRSRGTTSQEYEESRTLHEDYILGWRYGASIQTRPEWIRRPDIFEEGYLEGIQALRIAQEQCKYRKFSL